MKIITSIKDQKDYCNSLIKKGEKISLIPTMGNLHKGHESLLFESSLIKNKKITTSNTHGTGCTLSSAITTFFSCGKTLKKSCELATKYVNNSIRSNLNIGKGHGPINHLSSITIEKKFR